MKNLLRGGVAAAVLLAVLCINHRVLAQTNCVPAPLGLVSWWAGEGNALDSAGLNDGTAFGGVAYAAGEVGQGFVLDGVTGHVRVPDSPSLRIANALTLEAWVQPRLYASHSMGIIDKWDAFVAAGQASYTLYLTYDGRPHFALSASGSDFDFVDVWSSNTVPVGVWSHVAGTYDGTTTRLYINGSLQAAASWAQGIYPGTSNVAVGGAVGGTSPGQVNYPFAGMIDEPSVYARALAASEVQSIFAAGSSGKCVGPVGPYIVSEPASQTMLLGATVTFSVAAIGTPPLTYQWQLNSNNIPGATGSALVLTNVQFADAGAYSVIVSNLAGTATSSSAVLTVVAVPPCAAAPAGLAGWWAGEGNANDSVGTNNGILEGGLTFAPGKVGRAFSFDGITADVHVPASGSVDVGAGDGFTVEAWINPADVAERPLVEWNSGSFGVNFWLSAPLPAGGGPGSLWADVRDVNFQQHPVFSAGGLVVPNAWQHVALTYSKASGVADLYLNGNAVQQAAIGLVRPMTRGDLWFGLRPYDAGVGMRFAGRMDEVSLYSRALSAAEIQAVYSAGGSGKCPLAPMISAQPQTQSAIFGDTVLFSVAATGTAPLSYQWQVNSNAISGATGSSLVLTNVQSADAGAYSVIVSNLAGTATSSSAVLTVLAAAPCATAPTGLVGWWAGEGNAADSIGTDDGVIEGGLTFVPGKVGQAFNFDGATAEVRVPASPALDVGTGPGMTIEAWIRPASVSAEQVVAEWNNGYFGTGLERRGHSLERGQRGGVVHGQLQRRLQPAPSHQFPAWGAHHQPLPTRGGHLR